MSDERTYQIGNMDCANCAREVQTGVSRLDGVQRVNVDFASGKMRLLGDVDFDQLKNRVESLGKTIQEPASDDETPAVEQRGGVVGFWDYLVARHETRLALIGGAAVLIAVLASLIGLPDVIITPLLIAGMGITLLPIARSGINTLRINREFNINLLMTIAAVGAIIIGEYLEGAIVIFLFAIGEALEGYTAQRARSSIRSLMSLKPSRAIRLTDNGEQDVPVAALQIGDQILVKPGENIPMDGNIISGASGVNQAPITGESVPVAKETGDDVFAGSINGDGTLTVEVTRLAQDNTLSRIIKMVEEAQSVRARSQRLVDRFAAYYTPAVVVLATLVALVPPLLFNAPFYDTATSQGWLYRALAMLVIACPCALVISTPVTVISAITAAARRGVLIKGGVHLEALGTIQAIAFDKTGTLTTGKPRVTMVRSLACNGASRCDDCDDVLALAASVERRASHPLASAVLDEAASRSLTDRYAPAESVQTLAGRGVQGNVGERKITIGSHHLFDQEFPHDAAVCDAVQDAETHGQTTMMIADDQNVLGYIALADRARDDSSAVVKSLSDMGLQTIMLTGDNPRVAQAIADSVGVADFRASLMPEDKVTAVQALQGQYRSVAMVGDGINDTPALAAATVGVAMGGAGSPQALETADVVLMADDLNKLPFSIKMAQFARRLIKQNVSISFGMKGVFLLLALFGMTSLWVAILADVGVSILVTLNGMRPLRQ